jgi:hypothetical protein
MRAAAMLLTISLWNPAAAAGEITSAYTDLDLGKCKLVEQAKEGEGEWSRRTCAGYGGISVEVSEDDLRMTVSYGPDADVKCAASQTFNKFNYLGPRIEWRLADGKPFATILRWYQSADDVKTNWLVVTRYDGQDACHVAYVDPALPGANGVARDRADGLARNFDCEKDVPQIVSRQSVALSDLVSGAPCGERW